MTVFVQVLPCGIHLAGDVCDCPVDPPEVTPPADRRIQVFRIVAGRLRLVEVVS